MQTCLNKDYQYCPDRERGWCHI